MSVSCSVEGNSSFLSKGDNKYFLTMSGCEKEATSKYESGGKKYVSFECRKMLFGFFLLDSKTY